MYSLQFLLFLSFVFLPLNLSLFFARNFSYAKTKINCSEKFSRIQKISLHCKKDVIDSTTSLGFQQRCVTFDNVIQIG